MNAPTKEPLNAETVGTPTLVHYERAVRMGTHVIIALVSESGRGKTYSAILLGRGLVGPEGKLALLDTETGRGRMYSHLAGGYAYGELTPPFTPERYVTAIKNAEEAGYDCLIIDSGSHEWEGIGGIIEAADTGLTKDGFELKGLAKWAKPKARHKRFVQSLLSTRMHLIICLRAKEKLVQKGSEIVSAGYVSVQDKRFVYETTVQLLFPTEGTKGVPQIDKCPEDLIGAFPDGKMISVEMGAKIAQWVATGEPVDHTLAALKIEAQETASNGTAAMKAWWEKLTKDKQFALKPYLDNLRSIAHTADLEAIEDKPSLPSFAPVGEVRAIPADDAPTFGAPALTDDEKRAQLEDEYLPMHVERLAEDASAEDLETHNAEVRATLEGHDELLGMWNGHYLTRKRDLSKQKTQTQGAAASSKF